MWHWEEVSSKAVVISFHLASFAPWYPFSVTSPARSIPRLVNALITPFLQLCLLSRGPQDLPASRVLLLITITVYWLVAVAMGWPYYGIRSSVLQSVVELAMVLGFTRLALLLTRHPARFTQTATALTAAGALLGVVLLPVAYAIYQAQAQGAPLGVPAFAYIVVLGWLLLVYGNIFRHALSLKHLGLGVLVALGLVVLVAMVIQLLFSEVRA